MASGLRTFASLCSEAATVLVGRLKQPEGFGPISRVAHEPPTHVRRQLLVVVLQQQRERAALVCADQNREHGQERKAPLALPDSGL
jgi:hypothetical protein